MDYLKIVLDGYCNPNDRAFLDEYFQDELQKSKQSPERFFNGLQKAVETLKEIPIKSMNERKRELYFINNEETNRELTKISPNDFPINLLLVTGHKYSGYIKYEELNFIEATISSSISDKLKITDSDRPKQLNNELQEPKLEVKNPMKSKIENYFSFMLKNDFRKHQQILTETDFEKLIDWLTLYFENNFTIPEITEPIKTINTAKGNVIFSFKSFYRDEFPGTFPDSLFELIKRCFHQYRNDDIENMKKTKEPDSYKDLIKQNK